VVWECETCDSWIGQDETNAFGYYAIWRTESGWLEHSDHDLKGTATHPNFDPDIQTISDFSYQQVIYEVDFYLTPK
jgi:hypothetical protein